MGRPELGSKFQCTGCHERSYDLNRTPVVCPRCGVQQPVRVARAIRPVRESRHVRPPPPRPLVEDDLALTADTAAEEPDEDAEDAEDVEDEIEHEPEIAEQPV